MPQARVLTERDISRVLRFIANHKYASRNRAMFLLTTQTGMRIGEVAALRLSQVLTREGNIRDEIRLAPDQTKGGRGRLVVLSDKAQREIYQYLSARFRLKDLFPLTLTDTNRALFCTQKNPDRGFTASTLSQHFHYMYKRAGVDGASSHSGRRSFITHLAEKGVSVKVLMELAGHRSLSVTQRYIETNPSMLRRAVEMLRI